MVAKTVISVSISKDVWHSLSIADISVPLLQVALKSRILSPSSRLLRHRPSPLRASSTSSTIRSQDEGWSGSESEEEDYARAIRIIALRKLSHPSTPTPSKPKRPSLEQSTSSRFSQLSQTSEASASTVDSGNTLLTPSSSVVSTRPLPRLSSSRGPGDFPLGGSVPSSPTRQVSGLPTKGFYESMKSSPRNLPLREVEGWGPPEILADDDWPSTGGETTPGSDMAEASPTVASNFRVPESGVRSTWGG